MTVKHTSGPWFVVDHEDDRGIWVACTEDGNGHHDDGSYMCICATAIGPENARLIAAAPDMLAALYAALPYLETAEFDDVYKVGAVYKVAAMTRAAIAKAEASE